MLKKKVESLWIRGGQVVDVNMDVARLQDLFVVNGRIVDSPLPGMTVLDARDCLVCPGLMDLHVHLREPGQSHKETIATGTAAAAAGGFTFVASMPNTSPPIDNADIVRWILGQAAEVGCCEVGPVAAITRGRQGDELTDLESLLAAGAVAFSDDGTGVERDDVMLGAFEQAASLDALLIQHCEYKVVSAGGVMHKGEVSSRLGFPGLDPRSEEAMIERDLELCRKTRGRYHVAHISTARAVELVRRAKSEGLPVTTEVTPHHLILTDEACATANPNTKMHPPLRPQHDVDACRQGLLDGTIDCIATDHAPHTADEKAAGFLKAPPGLVGLETAIAISAKAMIETGLADWPQLLGWFSAGPRRVLRHPVEELVAGVPANLTVIDPTAGWTVSPVDMESKSRNTPFAGWRLIGQAIGTLRGGTLYTRQEHKFEKA